MSEQPSLRSSAEETDPEEWLNAYGDGLFRFAVLRVGDREAAEDLVQETFLAALQGVEKFAGQARISTWLYAILRRKISDHFRSKREPQSFFDESIVERPSGPSLDGKPLCRWRGDPASLFEEREFWTVFHSCAAKLPEKLGEAYLLREMQQLSPKEICEILDISPTNLSMRIYRARLLMRSCLESRWFRHPQDKKSV